MDADLTTFLRELDHDLWVFGCHFCRLPDDYDNAALGTARADLQLRCLRLRRLILKLRMKQGGDSSNLQPAIDDLKAASLAILKPLGWDQFDAIKEGLRRSS